MEWIELAYRKVVFVFMVTDVYGVGGTTAVNLKILGLNWLPFVVRLG